jgi:ubiquinone/menaquinone biosynthesis C-methylase UbiE
MKRKSPGTSRYPALMSERLTPLYDLFMRLFMPELKFKRALIEYVRLEPGQRVLDLGSGSGTLAILAKQAQPQVQIRGLDGDPGITAMASLKIARYALEIPLEVGDATALPYPDETFERVLSSLVLSLLSREGKQDAIREAQRVLRAGGELLVADFAPPHTWWGRWMVGRTSELDSRSLLRRMNSQFPREQASLVAARDEDSLFADRIQGAYYREIHKNPGRIPAPFANLALIFFCMRKKPDRSGKSGPRYPQRS